jgi:hypothetical protein
MRSFHSTAAWSTCTGMLLVCHSAPSVVIVTWKPAGIRRRPRVRSVARMAYGRSSIHAGRRYILHTNNGDALCSTEECLLRITGMIWVAGLLNQRREDNIKCIGHGTRCETKQHHNNEIKCCQHGFRKICQYKLKEERCYILIIATCTTSLIAPPRSWGCSGFLGSSSFPGGEGQSLRGSGTKFDI